MTACTHRRVSPLYTLLLALLFVLSGMSSPAAAKPSSRISTVPLPDAIPSVPLRFDPPKAKRFLTGNGLVFHVLPDHELPLVSLTLAVRAGSMYEPQGKEGLAELTAKVMREGGAAKMSGDTLDETLAFMAAGIEPSTGKEAVTWKMDVMKKDLPEAMDLLVQILREPRFDEGKLALLRDLTLEDLRRIADDPPRLAFREFNRRLYAEQARGRLPSRQSVQDLTKEDLQRFHRDFYHPGNMVMALSGDITEENAVRLVTEHFGQWPSLSPPGPVPIPVKAPGASLFYLIKDTPQSIVVAGHFAPAKRSPEYHAFETLDFILGSGGFNSHIFQEIRTNRGLSYSTGSFYRPAPEFGVFGVYAMTKTDAAVEALGLLLKILEDSRERMPENQKVDRAKRAILNSFVFKYQSSSQIAEQQMLLEFHSLPADFLPAYTVKVERLTGADLWEAAKDHIHPDKMVVVVLGNEKGYAEMKRRYPKMERVDMEHD